VSPLDQWFTPADLAGSMATWPARILPAFEPQTILEPSSGDGTLGTAALSAYPWATLTEYELDATLASATGAICQDFLTAHDVGQRDLCVMNPPYSGGLDGLFLEKALGHAAVVVALLRTHALHGVKRHARVWRSGKLRRVAFLSRRPRFSGSKGAPKHEFCVVMCGDESIPTGIEWW
jgi:predicted RNA methylase